MTLRREVEAYLAHAYSRGLAELSIKNQRSHLTRFVHFLEGQGVTHIADLTREVIEQYMDELSWAPTYRGGPMKSETRNVRLWSIKSFCRWLVSTDRLAMDPSKQVAYGRKSQPLPKNVLGVSEMQCLLAAPDPQTTLGFRNRVVLELLYSTALRVAELSNLDVEDLDLAQGFARVRRGKGGKDRVVPLGKLAVELTESYVQEIRPRLLEARASGEAQEALILSHRGERLGRAGIARLIAHTAKAAGLSIRVTPHSMRHSCATHMLRHGANIRHLQEMLGHKKLTSTEIYTRVTIADLKEVHARFHPRGSVDEAAIRKPKDLHGKRTRGTIAG